MLSFLTTLDLSLHHFTVLFKYFVQTQTTTFIYSMTSKSIDCDNIFRKFFNEVIRQSASTGNYVNDKSGFKIVVVTKHFLSQHPESS